MSAESERLARLERGEEETKKDISEIKSDIREIKTAVSQLRDDWNKAKGGALVLKIGYLIVTGALGAGLVKLIDWLRTAG